MTQILIVGGVGVTHVGQSLHHAAISLGLAADQLDHAAAYEGPKLLRSVIWRYFGHRPFRLNSFSARVEAYCAQHRPSLLLSTGVSPIRAQALERLRSAGVICANFSTDDPFSQSNGAWYFKACLPLYDWIFTPRRANLIELKQQCRNVEYLPFAYEPAHCVGGEPEEARKHLLHTEVLIVGGADDERLPIAKAIVGAGIKLALYGGYWDRDPILRPYWRGMAQPEVLREATLSADLVVCLVRRANRDGHVMRTFEAAATGACMVVEDTAEHREIFGPEGKCVVYFGNTAEMLVQIRRLLDAPTERMRLQLAVRDHIRGAPHTYSDRLKRMLTLAAPSLLRSS